MYIKIKLIWKIKIKKMVQQNKTWTKSDRCDSVYSKISIWI